MLGMNEYEDGKEGRTEVKQGVASLSVFRVGRGVCSQVHRNLESWRF